MFEGQGSEALELYVSVVPGSSVLEIERYGAEGLGKPGTIKLARVLLAGTEVMVSDSYVKHAFTFTPSVSLFITAADEAEFDAITGALNQGGQFLMPPGNYGFSSKFAWLNDRFGVSWQINLR